MSKTNELDDLVSGLQKKLLSTNKTASDLRLSDIDLVTINPLNEAKGRLMDYLCRKVSKLQARLNILDLKYNNLKYYNDMYHIAIIALSGTLTFLETIMAEIHDSISEWSIFPKTVMNLTPVALSSSITIVAAVLKFKKYQENMETMIRTNDNILVVMSEIKMLQERVRNSSSFEDVAVIKQEWTEDVYGNYNAVNEQVEKVLDYNDIVKHHQEFQELQLAYETSKASHLEQIINIRKTVDKSTNNLELQCEAV